MHNQTTPMIVSVISGKGGVGKSVIALNLAERFASVGLRTLAIDMNSSTGNLHLMANAAPRYGVEQYVNGSIELANAVVEITSHCDLLCRIGSGPIAQLSDAITQSTFVDQLRSVTNSYDIVIIDHASGMSEIATTIASHSDVSLLIVNPELTSIADCYGLYKYLTQKNNKSDNRILINRTKSTDDAEYLGARLVEMSQSFLRQSPRVVGAIFEDEIISQAIAAQTTLASQSAQSVALQQIEQITQELLREITKRRESTDGLVTPETTINNITATADIKE